jgi:hypothetical protein
VAEVGQCMICSLPDERLWWDLFACRNRIILFALSSTNWDSST